MTMTLNSQLTSPNTAPATSVSPLDESGSSNTKWSKGKKAPTQDLYQTVTDSIIKALEAGVKPWVCPWQRVKGMSGIPANYTTGASYSGMNIMLLWASASMHGFTDGRWLTYKQASAEGAQVRKGEKGTTAIFYTTLEKEDEQGETTKIPMLKTFTVFNVQQIDGLPLETTEPDVSPASEPAAFELFPQVETLMQQCGATITERGQAAYFRPSTDEIVLPERHLFDDAANFYATALHELVHWTGGKGRLNREMKGRFGSEGYAFEELIAELGSAFLMADFGVVGDVQHESYIASWLHALKNDKRFIFKAASSASKAHQFLIASNSAE
ncbi:antirestriction protein [Yersinia kristensenii]|nr:antirestriction protein [Yersinia kristensenii]